MTNALRMNQHVIRVNKYVGWGWKCKELDDMEMS